LESDKKAWVKIPKVTALTEKGVFMYYGNVNATSQSNMTNTFIFGDDFFGKTVDSMKWFKTDSGGYITQNGAINISDGTGTWGNVGMYSKASFERAKGLVIQGKYRSSFVNGASYKDTTILWTKDSTAGIIYSDFIYGFYAFNNISTQQYQIYEDGNYRGVGSGTFTANTPYNFRQIIKTTGGSLTQISTDGGSTWTDSYDSTYSTETPIRAGFSHYQGGVVTIDEVIVRKYSGPEPTMSTGSTLTSIDCGLRTYDGSSIITLGCDPLGTLVSPLRIYKGTSVYGLSLVDISDAYASKFRVKTNDGIKAVKKLGNGSGSGGSVSESGIYKTHTFSYPGGSFVVSGTISGADVLICAGGGGGGGDEPGGGGAGGCIVKTNFNINSGTYNAVVGAGGFGAGGNISSNGNDSTFLNLTAIGGGRGGTYTWNGCSAGGSGGGGGATFSGCAGLQPSSASGGFGNSGGYYYGGGGGAGGPGTGPSGGGGPGITWVDGNIYGVGGNGYPNSQATGGIAGGGGAWAAGGQNGIIKIRYIK